MAYIALTWLLYIKHRSNMATAITAFWLLFFTLTSYWQCFRLNFKHLAFCGYSYRILPANTAKRATAPSETCRISIPSLFKQRLLKTQPAFSGEPSGRRHFRGSRRCFIHPFYESAFSQLRMPTVEAPHESETRSVRVERKSAAEEFSATVRHGGSLNERKPRLLCVCWSSGLSFSSDELLLN